MNKPNKEELWKIYETLPSDLKQAVFSEETANSILSACSRSGLSEQQTSQVAETIGFHLLSILPAENLPAEIMAAANIQQNQANQILVEINRLVFYPIKNSLAEIYTVKSKPPTENSQTAPRQNNQNATQNAKISETPTTPTSKQKSIASDTYRESLEQ